MHYFAGWWVMLAAPFLLLYGVGWGLACPLAWGMFGLLWLLWAPLAIALQLPYLSTAEMDVVRMAGSLLYSALFYRFHDRLGTVWRWLGAMLRKPLRIPRCL